MLKPNTTNVEFQLILFCQFIFFRIFLLKVLEYPSHLLGINKDNLRKKLVSRTIETKTASKQERIEVTLNIEQAEYTRDALAKGIYSRLFDYLVAVR